ncbi:vanadium-dependent haloperoxidase [Lacibacter sp.]|uniref:vanadium-dependent haloperoxidase n=1 Tax=Lacibacter sp. TaxID=1915409 RepID=UPI002B4B3916|nr:vanadium-dependent haloperoxidase [Lacibacter sp.]HLP39211.1 vanadium-dependent haloperoxidase [Lacibacter sp.]
MKGKSRYIQLFILVVALCSCSGNNKQLTEEPRGANNRAYQWGKISLEATANDTETFRPRPTVTARMLGLVWTAVFDAWSRYDEMARPLYLQQVERVPQEERTIKNKEIAISYAAYRAMLEYFYSDSVMLRNKMKEFGLDPDNQSTDPTTPEGIGNLAAKTVIEARLNDGSNQTGTMPGSNGKVYSDYTGYMPVNSADTLIDIKRWQPKYFADGKGGKFAPACLTPHWGKVKPLLLDSGNQFRCQPPPAIGSAQLEREVKEVVELQAALTNEQKALVEFMRDGPKSVQQAGHWLIFAQDVSVRDNHTLDQDVKMYFVVEAAAMDGFIACWDTKMEYDFARPYTLVHYYFKDKTIKGWGGPDKGMIEMPGQEWRPYSPETFLCPPFPSYISGHSSISGACAEILRLFTGSDKFGVEVKRKPGEMTEPDRVGAEVTLSFPTFTETANMAGLSRVLGGYHIQCENEEGLKLGRNVAALVWQKYLYHIGEKN